MEVLVKMNVNEAVLLGLYEASEEDVKEVFEGDSVTYATIINSERYAKKIMEDAGLTFVPLNKKFKNYYSLLTIYVYKYWKKIYDEVMDLHLLDVPVDNDDVCERLKEQKVKYINRIDVAKMFQKNDAEREKYIEYFANIFNILIQKASEMDLLKEEKTNKKTI